MCTILGYISIVLVTLPCYTYHGYSEAGNRASFDHIK